MRFRARIGIRIADERVYRWIMNLCLLIALCATLATQAWPGVTFAATIVAVLTALAALAIYFSVLEDSAADKNAKSENNVRHGDRDTEKSEVRSHEGVVKLVSDPDAERIIQEAIRAIELGNRERVLAAKVERIFRDVFEVHKATSSAWWSPSEKAVRENDPVHLWASYLSEVKERRTLWDDSLFEMIRSQIPEQKTSPSFRVKEQNGRFMVIVGPVRIVVTETETSVDIVTPKATGVRFVRPGHPVVGEPTTPAMSSTSVH